MFHVALKRGACAKMSDDGLGQCCCPTAVWALVCTFLTVPAALHFTTQVVRLPGILVPWSYVGRSFRSEKQLARLNGTVLRLAVLPRLRVLEAFLTDQSCRSLERVLREAKGLQELRLSGHALLLEELGAVLPVTTLSLQLWLKRFTDHEYLDSTLEGFLRFVPALAHLALDFSSTQRVVLHPVVIQHVAPRLRSLELSGQYVLHRDFFVDLVPGFRLLSKLKLNIFGAKDPELLCSLPSLQTCILRAQAARDLSFTASMNTLHTLHVSADYPLSGALLLPPNVREVKNLLPTLKFACPDHQLRVLELPARDLLRHAAHLKELEGLTTQLSDVDLSEFLALVSSLSRLRRLHLQVSFPFEAPSARMRATIRSASCPNIVELVLEDSETAPWLTVFPCATSLELRSSKMESTKDPELLEAFALCPHLQRLAHKCAAGTLTVTKRQDGRLIKRVRDKRDVLN
jgi:hypothetical protein